MEREREQEGISRRFDIADGGPHWHRSNVGSSSPVKGRSRVTRGAPPLNTPAFTPFLPSPARATVRRGNTNTNFDVPGRHALCLWKKGFLKQVIGITELSHGKWVWNPGAEQLWTVHRIHWELNITLGFLLLNQWVSEFYKIWNNVGRFVKRVFR